MSSPFEILGVSEQASDTEIKKAYKNLAKELHPDKTQGDSAKEAKFKEVKEAYEKIKNAEAREEFQREEMSKQYARQGFHGQSPFGNGQGFQYRSSDIDEDILNEIFGSFRRGGGGFGSEFGQRRKAEPLSATINLSFWEAAKGGEKVFSFPEGAKISVNVPAGVKDGQKIRLKGQANKLQRGASGDLYLEVRVAPDSKASFTKNNDILLEYDLPVDTAIMGGELDVQCPLGRFKVQIPAYTNNGAKFKLKGKGPKGADLIIRANLKLPMDKKENLQALFRGANA